MERMDDKNGWQKWMERMDIAWAKRELSSRAFECLPIGALKLAQSDQI
jgi:hypothetical protein